MRTRNWYVLVLIVLVVFCTATVVPSLPAQEVPAPVSLPSPDASPAVYRLTLDEANERALAHNKALELARLNVQEKQIGISAAKRDYFPKLLATGAYLHFNESLGTVLATRTRTLGGASIGPGGILQIPTITIPGQTISANVVNQDATIGALLVAQPITKLIGVSALVDLAKADEGIAAAQLDKGTRDLLSGIAQAYYGLRAAQRVHAALALQLGMVEQLNQAKPTVELRLSLLEMRKGLAEADQHVAELTDVLNQLLDLPPCTRLELVEPALPPVPVACEEQAAQLALANNPQVREAEQNIMKARAALKAAKMDCLPDVNLIGGGAAQSFADYIQPEFAFVGVTASYTFVDWGKRREVKRQREAQIALAHKNVEVVSETVQLDARKAFLAFKHAEQELQIANETVAARQDAEKEAKQPAEVLTAKADTARAQLDQMQAELNYRLVHAKLLAAIGQP
jgi:outer membrane protein TolC